ncbi:MAG: ribonuclease H-like domain-containing protein [Spirochaetales bacterium]|nr:ribonuclease H-like domain-containing protein [Spirochaetales bacterium]
MEDGLHYRESSFEFSPRREGVRLGIFSRRLDGVVVQPADLLFFDLETTGLSGGSGTVAFLAGCGSLAGNTFTTRQYFMDDYPAEPAFLRALDSEFRAAAAVVTYNGSSFDIPLYTVRMAMNGNGAPVLPPHADALHAARRLWRRTIGTCTLGGLELAVLGKPRVDDIPGSMIPDAWFEYVKQNKADAIIRVFEHNAIDITSLAELFFIIADSAEGVLEPSGVDPVGLGELQSRVDRARAQATLSAALEAGDSRAARPLLRLYRLLGQPWLRSGIIPMLPDDAAGLFAKSVHAERVSGNLEEAYLLALRSASCAKEGSAIALRAHKRAERMARKSAGLTGQSSSV